MKNHVKGFSRWINESTRMDQEIEVMVNLGLTAGEMADYLASLSEIAPSAVIMRARQEDDDELFLEFHGTVEEITAIKDWVGEAYGGHMELPEPKPSSYAESWKKGQLRDLGFSDEDQDIIAPMF